MPQIPSREERLFEFLGTPVASIVKYPCSIYPSYRLCMASGAFCRVWLPRHSGSARSIQALLPVPRCPWWISFARYHSTLGSPHGPDKDTFNLMLCAFDSRSSRRIQCLRAAWCLGAPRAGWAKALRVPTGAFCVMVDGSAAGASRLK